MIRWHGIPLVAAALLPACASAPPATEVRLVAQAFADLNAASAPLLAQLVATYSTEDGSLTLAGLAQRSAQLSARADTWRRTFSALPRGTSQRSM